MPNARGHMLRAGFKKATVYGTAVAVGAGDGLYLLSERIRSNVPRIDDTSAGGGAQLRGADISAKAFGGPIVTPARYEGRWLTLLAMAFGTAGTPSGAGPYVHTLKPADDPSGLFGTLVLDKQIGANPAWEYDAVHVEAVTLRAQAGTGDAARLAVEIDLIARNLNRASATNGTTQLNALTYPAAPHALFHHLTVRMNANAGGALGAPDELKIRSLELTLRNGYARDLFTSNSQLIDQPARENFLEVVGSLAIDKYSADSPGLTEFLDATYMKADVVWNAGADKIVSIELPYLQLTGGDRDHDGPGLIRRPIPFKAFKPTSAPTGMTATDTMQIKITNNVSTDLLA